MADPAQKLATYQDVLDAPAHMRAEVLNGDLHLQPRPGRKHARVSSILGMKVGGAFELGTRGPGGWVIIDEPELHLQLDILVPDIAGWHRESYAQIEGNAEASDAYFEKAPDWVCEVLSPSTAKYDRTQKMSLYAREGVSHLWLIDPQLRTLEVYRLFEEDWLLIGTHSDDALVRAEPFDAVELELGALWS